MAKKSAGILLYRFIDGEIQFLLVHPGGPFWVRKDIGAWSIPKGEMNENEQPLDAAIREFEEELGTMLSGNFIPLTPVKQAGGKLVFAFGLEKDFDTTHIKSNTFSMEWPPKSGRQQEFPEIDRAEWFDMETLKLKIIPAQMQFVNELSQKLL